MCKFFGLFLIVLLSIGKISIAQPSFLSSPNAYLGQPLPGDTPKTFALGLLADTGEFSANRTAISSDGKEIFYSTNKTWANSINLKVKYFHFDGKKWVGPIVVAQRLSETSISPDNNSLYFCSDDSAGVLFRSVRTKKGWSPPQRCLVRNYLIYDFMMAKNGNKYTASNGTWGTPNDANAWKFSVMAASDADTGIQSLGSPPNSPGFNGDFYIARDESYMIISRESDSLGAGLYISFRKKDNTWTDLTSLGPLINDGNAHRYGQFVSPDEKYLFYTRATTEADCAIHWVRFDGLLESFKKNLGL